MENNPMSLLMAEHEVIIGAKGVIEAMNGSWTTSGEVYEQVFLQLINFFRKYSDGFHHRKEEDQLFTELRNHPEFMLQSLIDELEEHHESFRQQVATMEQSLTQKKYALAQSQLSAYFNDLLDHISVEDEELFVMSESLFSENVLERMYFRFKDIDQSLGESSKQELEDSIAKMKALL